MSFVNVVHAPESGGLYRNIYLGGTKIINLICRQILLCISLFCLFIVFNILNIEQSCGGLRCSLVGT